MNNIRVTFLIFLLTIFFDWSATVNDWCNYKDAERELVKHVLHILSKRKSGKEIIVSGEEEFCQKDANYVEICKHCLSHPFYSNYNRPIYFDDSEEAKMPTGCVSKDVLIISHHGKLKKRIQKSSNINFVKGQPLLACPVLKMNFPEEPIRMFVYFMNGPYTKIKINRISCFGFLDFSEDYLMEDDLKYIRKIDQKIKNDSTLVRSLLNINVESIEKILGPVALEKRKSRFSKINRILKKNKKRASCEIGEINSQNISDQEMDPRKVRRNRKSNSDDEEEIAAKEIKDSKVE